MLSRSTWNLLLLSLIAVILIGLLMPVRTGHGEPAPRTACLSNIKQVGVGMLMYVADHDERFPPRDLWMDVTFPYTKSAHIYRSTQIPEGQEGYGYAMNSRLSLSKTASIAEPPRHPMLYDSINFARNASDPCLSLPPAGRHEGGNHLAATDTSAKFVRLENTLRDYSKHFTYFKPEKKK
ncbi:MAG TPA: hypothetical protein VEX38_02470 [Fimbriimonadaceae bacterium]|nr:hypothetical protein [Fimbriimonadaceae bacterium]